MLHPWFALRIEIDLLPQIMHNGNHYMVPKELHTYNVPDSMYFFLYNKKRQMYAYLLQGSCRFFRKECESVFNPWYVVAIFFVLLLVMSKLRSRSYHISVASSQSSVDQ